MASGDLITYSNFKAMYPTAWRFTNEWKDTNVTICINSCSFVLRVYVSSVLFRSATSTAVISYWNGSEWVPAYTLSVSKSGAGSAEAKWYHNRADEGTGSGDQHLYQCWRAVITMSYAGSAHAYFNCYVGGIETMNETEYNSYFQGKAIRGINGDYWTIGSGGTYSNESAFLQACHPSTKAGTPISVSAGTAKYICYEQS